MQKRTVRTLIIDDDREDAMILQRYLGNCSANTVKAEYATDLRQALKKLVSSRFDLIFLDNRLGGGITAQDVLENFLEQNINVPVVVVTGQGDEQTAVQMMKSGAYDYITKGGLTTEMLEKTILNTIERHSLETRQKQSEKEVKQQQELLANIISNIPHFVFWKDRKSVYLGCNDNFAKVAGVESAENIVGKTDYDLAWKKEEADFFVKIDREVMENGKGLLNIEEPQLQADGKEATLLTSKVPLRDPEGKVIGLLGIYADITEQKQTEQTLKNLNEELAATVEMLTLTNLELADFAHIVAHDLKAPLRAIGTLADWVSIEYSNKLDKTGQEEIKLLINRAQRMSKMIDGILKYSKIGHTEQKEETDFNSLLAKVIGEMGRLEDIEITVTDELPTLICNKASMMEVFQNLLSNAVKYMDKPKGQIKVGCVEENDFWKFSIADNGPGIEQKYFEKVFKIFQTLSPRDEIESTGIGLTMVKKVIELYGGKVWVKSKLDKGSTFFFTLPKQEKETKSAKFKADIACGR